MQKHAIDEYVPGTPRITVHTDNHTPFNFRPGERKGNTSLQVIDYDGHSNNPNAWLNVIATEQITSPSGRVIERTISIVLDEDARGALIAMLKGRG